MTTRPILFSGPMVRALQAGTKTQTRRLVKFDREIIGLGDVEQWARGLAGNACYGRPITEADIKEKATQLAGRIHPVILEDGSMVGLRCPYGQPGDRLWVRETWAPNLVIPIENRPAGDYLYAATNAGRYAVPRWKPSIHMPRAASRITLEITGVRVERLQDISIGDAIAEGIPRGGPENPDGIEKREYRALWEQINGPGSWDANPWVWVDEFKVLEATCN